MNIRRDSMTKEIQELFKKINAIFQVLALDDLLGDFNIEKKKEIEYEITKSLATLEVQLNSKMFKYDNLRYSNEKKQLKKTVCRDRVKPTPAIQNAAKNKESVLPVDVNEMRKVLFNNYVPKKTESGHLIGISGSTVKQHID